jgi:hypothetical protein
VDLAPDEIRPVFRLLVALGIAGIVILGIGLGQFVHYEPPGQQTGQSVKIGGIYDYDVKTGRTFGSDKDHFRTDEPFAAVVDWSSLPPDLLVGANWFSGGFALDSGGVGPARAADLTEKSVVPVNRGAQRFPAGTYDFVVERYAGGRPVEVLGGRSVIVVGAGR